MHTIPLNPNHAYKGFTDTKEPLDTKLYTCLYNAFHLHIFCSTNWPSTQKPREKKTPRKSLEIL